EETRKTGREEECGVAIGRCGLRQVRKRERGVVDEDCATLISVGAEGAVLGEAVVKVRRDQAWSIARQAQQPTANSSKHKADEPDGLARFASAATRASIHGSSSTWSDGKAGGTSELRACVRAMSAVRASGSGRLLSDGFSGSWLMLTTDDCCGWTAHAPKDKAHAS
ncbi:9183_t:CDS:2, partial [Scutellospora calospora]